MSKRPCLDCGTPTTRTRCPTCQRPRDAANWQQDPNRDPTYRAVRAGYATHLPLPCSLCDEPITHTGQDGDALTLDHHTPWVHGGTNDPSNLRPAHRRCNSARGAPEPH